MYGWYKKCGGSGDIYSMELHCTTIELIMIYETMWAVALRLLRPYFRHLALSIGHLY